MMTETKKFSKKNKVNFADSAELFKGLRSEIAFLAITKTGAGIHADKRKTKKEKKSWKKEDWS